jgi:hypothetical protein
MTEIRIEVDLPPLAPGRAAAPELSPAWKTRTAESDEDEYRQSTTACCPRQTIPDSCGCLEGCGCLCADCDCGTGCDCGDDDDD